MASIYQTLSPGFAVQIQQGANPVLNFTVYDRAGNVVDLTGFKLKLAAKRIDIRSDGAGKLRRKETVILDEVATILDATLGNISVALPPSVAGTPGNYPASLRIWNTTTTTRFPDDAYDGALEIVRSVVRVEG